MVGSLSFIFRAKNGLKKLPNWVWSLGWVAFAFAMFEILGPLVDWISAYPGYFVLMIGFFSYAGFLFGLAWEWRHGSDQLDQVAASIRFRPREPGEPLYGLWIILGAMLAVIAGVVVAALVFAPTRPETGPMLTIVLGGLSAGIAGPFFLYPTIYLVGWCRAKSTIDVTVALSLGSPRPDALDLRAQLDRMPPPRGTGRLRPTDDGGWRAKPIHLANVLLRQGEAFRVVHRSPHELQVENLANSGDVELKRFKLQNGTTLNLHVTATCRSAWSKGLLVFAGQAGFERLIITVEMAILSVMLGCDVEQA